MSTNVVSVSASWTIGKTLKFLRQKKDLLPDDIYEVYILDSKKGKELDEFPGFNEIKLDPLLYQLSCSEIGFDDGICINKRYNSIILNCSTIPIPLLLH